MQHSYVVHSANRLTALIMPDSSRRLERVMHDIMTGGEPPEWQGRRPPETTRWHAQFPPVLDRIPLDRRGGGQRGGFMRYHCDICRKVATITHKVSIDHIEKTTTKLSESLGYYIPRWMARFKGFDTTDKTEGPFDESEYEQWPAVCTECNCKLADARHRGCNVCRPAATRATGSTGESGKDSPAGGDGKRSRATDSKADEEGGRTSKPKLAVARSPVQGFREQEASGSRQTGMHKDHWRPAGSSYGSHTDKGT